MTNAIGVTERADPTVNLRWLSWVEGGNPAILITKVPRLLYSKLRPDWNIKVHCTITGMGHTELEPNIEPWRISLDYYHKLCTFLGKERVVLRIDPILRAYGLPVYRSVLKEIAGEREDRMRISFLDCYSYVAERVEARGISLNQRSFHLPIAERYKIWKELGEPEMCAEPGLLSTSCVSSRDCEILNVEPSTERKGQRKLCGCLANKTELCYWPPKCTYGCLYCYWK